MAELKGVLLDLDGTLANTEDYNYSYAKGVKTEELIEYKLYEFLKPILKVVTWGEFIELFKQAQKSVKLELKGTAASHNRYLYIQKTLELCGVNFVPDIIQRAVDYYFEVMLKRTELYPGVIEVLKCFKYNQLKTCMITDFTADIQIKKIRKLGIMKYIDYMVTSEEAGSDKPNTDQPILALKKLGLSQDEVVMIGNNPKTDIQMAIAMDIRSFLFDPRKLYPEGGYGETFYLQDFSKIPALLNLPTRKYSRKKMLIIDFVGTLTNERNMIEEVLSTFIHKDPAYVSATYKLFRQGDIGEPEFWYRLGIGEIKKAHKAIAASITIRKSVITVLKRLSQEYDLVLLTDFPGQWGRSIMEERGIANLFSDMIFGNDTTFQKPDRALYKYLLQKYSTVNPENITLIDDNPAALLSGRDFLMHTILVGNAKEGQIFVPDAVIEDFIEVEFVLKKREKLNR